jgi:nicotinate-nucleotide pyrophosphorylase (carboxylating)
MTRLSSVAEAVHLLRAHGLDLAGVEPVVVAALSEDLGGHGVLPAGAGHGVDVTSVATIPADATATAEIIARASGRMAGLPVAAYVLLLVCAEAGPVEVDQLADDGTDVVRGDVVLRVRANTRELLRAERIALNLLTLTSGVATATAAWVAALEGSRTRVRDSRKTVPGLRMLQKYAVLAGGGVNHRMSLADAALIKDNHVIAAGGVVPAFLAVRREFPDIPVQVEVTSARQAHEVVAAGAVDVLLDNMAPAEMAAVMAELGELATFEASGGLTLDTAATVAATGVHFVAIGAITHSAPILDFALDFFD